MTKKKEASPGKKAAATKAKKSAAAAAEAAKPRKEIDVDRLEVTKARKMLGSIHKLEKNVERAAAALAIASKQRRSAKAKHEQASEALELEIREQRFGPGPLFNVDGSGANGTAQGQKAKTEKKPELVTEKTA